MSIFRVVVITHSPMKGTIWVEIMVAMPEARSILRDVNIKFAEIQAIDAYV